MKIVHKLTAGYLVIGLLLGVAAYVGIRGADAIHNEYNDVARQTIPVIEALQDLRFAGLRIVSSANESALIRAERERPGVTDAAVAEAEETRLVETGRELFAAGFTGYEDLVNRLFPQEKEFLENLRSTGRELHGASAALVELKRAGAPGSEILEKKEELEGAERAFLLAVDAALAHEDQEFAERSAEVDSAAKTAVTTALIAGIVAFIVAVASGILISRSISNPIIKLRDTAARLGSGNLGARVDVSSRDEVGELARSFNQMAEDLGHSRRELIEAQDRVVRTERLAAIGELSAGVAHELRNPLGAIKNAAYYIRGRLRGSDLLAANPRVGEFMEIMDQEIETSNQIITDLMDFARVNPPSLSPTNLETVVDNALARMELKENVTTVKEFHSPLPQVLADGEQLRRAFANIIKNADEAMTEGGTLTIAAEVTDGFVELKFRDTGHGISDADLPRVFDPLFTTKPRGIGLGLPIVNSIIERHGGTVTVGSEPGEGATFLFRLPLRGQQEA